MISWRFVEAGAEDPFLTSAIAPLRTLAMSRWRAAAGSMSVRSGSPGLVLDPVVGRGEVVARVPRPLDNPIVRPDPDGVGPLAIPGGQGHACLVAESKAHGEPEMISRPVHTAPPDVSAAHGGSSGCHESEAGS